MNRIYKIKFYHQGVFQLDRRQFKTINNFFLGLNYFCVVFNASSPTIYKILLFFRVTMRFYHLQRKTTTSTFLYFRK